MNKTKPYMKGVLALAVASGLALPAVTRAAGDEELAAMKARVEALEKELAQMRALLEKKLEAKADTQEVEQLKKEVATASSNAQEWKEYDSRVHLGGYASAGFAGSTVDGERFTPVQFAPILHYQWRDLLLLESELELQVQRDGTTEVGLEYLTIDLFLNDYITFLAGKFLSPVGNFRQNLHPAWINKLPSAPSGFGHDQAAPVAEVGAQFRGGVPLGERAKVNYSIYVANGPTLDLSPAGDEIEALGSEGAVSNDDDEFVFGGRLGFLPIPHLELGVSGACCSIAVAGAQEASRSYSVLGFDAAWKWRNLDLRGEYVRSRVGSEITSVAPDGQRWEAFYVQAAYRLTPFKLEPVVRYANYDSTHADQEQEQWTVGINYLFAPQAMAKLAYEFNDGLQDTRTDDDRFLLQFAYGF